MIVVAVLALSAVALSTPAAKAQAPSNQPASESRSLNLNMEQRHIIKEIILKELKIAPQSADVPTKAGDVVPAGVPLQPIPVEVSAKIPQLKAHSFIVKDNAVLIVEPNTNRIAEKVD